jgi:hypothetical protein
MVSEETFFAWLDGELDPAEAARIEAAVAADPHLAAKAAEHRSMQSKLNAAFGTLVDAPVPDSILASLRNPPAAEVVDFTEAKKRRTARRWPSAAQWGSMAATLALGIFVGTALPDQRDAGPVSVHGGKIYTAAAIGRALDTQLASAPAGDVRIGMTFRDHSGSICRSFTTAASSGVACHDKGGWQLRGLFAAPAGQSNDYRMAAGMDPALASLVDSTIAGEPFDAEQEQAARQRHWK